MRYVVFCSILALIMAGATGALAQTGRDPFEAKADIKNPYRYERAVELLTLQGIVRTEKDRRAIVTLPDTPGPAVLKEGDDIAIRYRGLSHRFTVADIGVRNVRFRARSGADYEVFIR